MFLLSGVARYLFVPLAEAVVFAMLASYFLSRTIVPTMAKYLLRGEKKEAGDAPSRNPLVRFQKRFEEAFERFRHSYRGLLEICLHHRLVFLIAFFAVCLGSLVVLIPWLGQDFFPSVDSGTFKLHMRAPTGMRIEETANLCDQVEQSIREADSGRRSPERHRQHRPALQRHQSFLQQFGAGWHIGRRHSCDPVRQAPSHGQLHSPASSGTPETVSGCFILFLARRHGRADSQFWIARSHRCSGRRKRPAGKPRSMQTHCSRR